MTSIDTLPQYAQNLWREFWAREASYTNRFHRCRAAFLHGYEAARRDAESAAYALRDAQNWKRQLDNTRAAYNQAVQRMTNLSAQVRSAEQKNQSLEQALDEARKNEHEVRTLLSEASDRIIELDHQIAELKRQGKGTQIVVEDGGTLHFHTSPQDVADALRGLGV